MLKDQDNHSRFAASIKLPMPANAFEKKLLPGAQKFVDLFGMTAGCEYFAAGLSMEEAATKFNAAQRKQIEALEAEKAKLQAQLTGLAARN